MPIEIFSTRKEKGVMRIDFWYLRYSYVAVELSLRVVFYNLDLSSLPRESFNLQWIFSYSGFFHTRIDTAFFAFYYSMWEIQMR